jgi:hypothetical protein
VPEIVDLTKCEELVIPSYKIGQGTLLILPWSCKECLSVVYLKICSWSPLGVSMTNICKGVTVPSGCLHGTSVQSLKVPILLVCLFTTKVPFSELFFCSRKAFKAFLTVSLAGYARK